MKKLYQLTMSTSEHSTLFLIIEDPQIKDGYIQGTKVGKLQLIDINDRMVFEGVEPVDFMAGGAPWTLEEYKGDLV